MQHWHVLIISQSTKWNIVLGRLNNSYISCQIHSFFMLIWTMLTEFESIIDCRRDHCSQRFIILWNNLTRTSRFWVDNLLHLLRSRKFSQYGDVVVIFNHRGKKKYHWWKKGHQSRFVMAISPDRATGTSKAGLKAFPLVPVANKLGLKAIHLGTAVRAGSGTFSPVT
jgi:hypothetical protein